jgi:hypothetical protein
MVWTGIFVEGIGSYARAWVNLLGIGILHEGIILTQIADHAVTADLRLSYCGTALDAFAQMPG